MNEADIEFLKKWLAVLNDLYPEARARVNGVSIRLTGRYVAIDAASQVEIATVERDECRK